MTRYQLWLVNDNGQSTYLCADNVSKEYAVSMLRNARQDGFRRMVMVPVPHTEPSNLLYCQHNAE